MEEVLQNEALQAALIGLAVFAINALVAWLKSLTVTSKIESNWCYLQPIIADALKEKVTPETNFSDVVMRYVVRFIDDYRKFENKEPSNGTVNAAMQEIESAVRQVK